MDERRGGGPRADADRQQRGLAVVEAAIRAAMTALGGSLLEQVLALDPGHRSPQVACGAGNQAEFVAYREKNVDTVLGPLTLRRAWYHCPDRRAGHAPLDAQLQIVGASLSPRLRVMIDRAAAAVPFAPARSLLSELAGITLNTKRIERAAEADGITAAATQAEHARAVRCGRISVLAPARSLPDKLYLAVDDTGVPVTGTGVPVTGAETRGRAGKGEDGRARTREVKLAALFTQTRLDEHGHPIRDPDSTSYLATLDPVEVFTDLLDAHARQRGAEHICQLVILGNNAHRMRYKHFRDLGLFVEAGCKAVIGQRLKLSGMHWSARGATVITTLRCHHAIAPSTHASAA